MDLGCELISIRGYDNYNDAVDYGRYILPRVREELDRRGKGESAAPAPAKESNVVVPTAEVPAESG